jgi:hypothetical protein
MDGKPKQFVHWEGGINVGTVIHLLVLLAFLVSTWVSVRQSLMLHEIELEKISAQTARIEKYLSGRDPHYWETVHSQETKNDPK